MGLTSEHPIALQSKGHFVKRGAIGGRCLRRAEAAAQTELQRIVAGSSREYTSGQPIDYLTATHLWERSDDLRSVVCSARLGRLAATALGAKRVRLLYDQLFVKPPGARSTVWHQDQVYWPIDASDTQDDTQIRAVRIWVSLQPLPTSVGGLLFVDGSHHSGPIDPADLVCAAPGSQATVGIADRSHSVTDYGGFGAGDATVHAGYTLHAARKNESKHTRFGLSMVYVADGARVAEPQTEQHQTLIDTFIPGRAPGDRIDTEINPVLWPRERA